MKQCSIRILTFLVLGMQVAVGSSLSTNNDQENVVPKDIFTLINQNNVNQLVQLLKQTKNISQVVNQQDKDGNTPLMYAAIKGNAELVEKLLYYGARVDIVNRKGNSVLMHAIKYAANPVYAKDKDSYGRILALILKRCENQPAVLNKENSDGLNPLAAAIFYKDLMVVKALVDIGANLDMSVVNHETNAPESLVKYAQRFGTPGIVNLLANKINVKKSDLTLNDLSDAGFDTKKLNEYKKFLEEKFFDALKSKDYKIAQDALSKLGKKFPKDDENLIAAYKNAVRSGDVAGVQLALQAGADADGFKSTSKSTPLADAVWENHATVVQHLLRAGADPNKLATQGSVLRIALTKNNPEVVDSLLEHGVDVNQSSGDISLNGMAPLHYAAIHSSPEIVNKLVQAGSDLNAFDREGYTPLARAVIARRGDVVQSILGAPTLDFNKKNARNETIMDIAARCYPKHAEIDSMLQHHQLKLQNPEMYNRKGAVRLPTSYVAHVDK